MRTTQQNTTPVYNQINRQLIELVKRRDTILIITLFEQISYFLIVVMVTIFIFSLLILCTASDQFRGF
ncbi:hypothetical protein HZS_1097 [Henneguya salminicola]|nr:hypothetical protein HZS_1097 [Henneguya salminicola]